jgi:hypothetical protein
MAWFCRTSDERWGKAAHPAPPSRFLRSSGSSGLRGFPGLQLAGFLVFLLEAIDAAFGVNEFLAAGEEGVAIRAYFHTDVAFVSRAGTERIAARAGHIDFLILGVDPCFHYCADSFQVGTN